MRITQEEARRRLLPRGEGARKAPSAPLALAKVVRHGEDDTLYIFERQGMHIAAPADDSLPPILAEFESNGKYSAELEYYLKGYSDEVAACDGVAAKAPKMQESIQIEPLLGNIEWGQKAPFWDNLKFPHPTKANTRVYCCTGCVATAIAQVVYYLARKGVRRGCRATKAYTTTKYKYSVAALPSVAMFDWSYMTEQTPKTKQGKKAVAQLMEYCGKASKADYGYSSTSAPMANVVPTLRDFFGLGDARRLQNMSNAALKSEIIAELKKGNPVIMCGSGSNGECHCFVCDGYRSSDDMMHFNWGWNGDGNGWFKLTALNPQSHDFTSKKNAVVGMHPRLLGDVNGDGRINISDATAAINAASNGQYDIHADVNFDGKVDLEDTNIIIDVILGKGGL